MTKYNLEYLQNRLGTFNKDFKYPNKRILGSNLIYIETQTKKELNECIDKIKDKMNPGYIWGYVNSTESTYVTRAFGENQIFTYNPEVFKNRTEYVKGKQKVLNNLTEDSINELFDQKIVFNHFYEKLWYLRIDLGKEIRDQNNLSDNESLMAAQHIIDRILFTYFICGKKLLNVNGKEPISGQKLFTNIISRMPDPWRCLKTLFFRNFAKNGTQKLKIGSKDYIQTRYLNGGLFRPKIIEGISEEELIIKYTKKQWQDLFEPLNKYTWIIEDEIMDYYGEYEGNLTPEIIGHIYEKFVITMVKLDEIKLEELKISDKGELLKGNKEIGAYYTEEYITDFISQNTIKPKLFDQLGIVEKIDFDDFVNAYSSEVLEEALGILDKMTICDPACGSGAFLIKSGEILLEYKSKINKKLKNKNMDLYNLKKYIIINNLYGVDIQEGAIEICKLRLWLWLISSSKNQKFEPLPNIEYNFIIGNSLMGWAKEKLGQNLLVKIDESVLNSIESLNINNEIGFNQIKENLQNNDIQSYAEVISFLKNIYSYSTDEEAEKLKDIIESIKKFIYKEVDRIYFDSIESKGRINFVDYENFNPFHWKVDFNKIFKDGGFDIVIGNPPYGFRGVLTAQEKKIFRKNLEISFPTGDIAELFFKRGLNALVKPNGYFSFIIPKKSIYGESWGELREYLRNYYTFFFSDAGKAFTDVKLEMIVFGLVNKLERNRNIEIWYFNQSQNIAKTLGEVVDSNNGSEPFYIYSLNRNAEIYDLLKEYKTLNDFDTRISMGQSNITKYMLNERENKEDIPILKGKDISQYQIRNLHYLPYSNVEKEYLIPKLIIQKIVSHIKNPFPHIQLMGIVDKKGIFNIHDTAVLYKSEKINLESMLLLMNSKIISWFLYNFTYDRAIRTMDMIAYYANQIPIPTNLENYNNELEIICDYLLFLNQTALNKEIGDFFKNEIIDTLFYELYFDKKIKEKRIYFDSEETLMKLVSNYLKTVEFDEWESLYLNKLLNSKFSLKNQLKLEKISKINLEIIQDVSENIKHDVNIQRKIEKIRSMSWVKLIEEGI
ncbi:hypothetical protein Metbo_1556 [Methanobacterium lacus]|uniref:site-specific DNA-methyltransferase (adenine-specific) n=1 Tax=Methanobacterium lacus (strain AL-21) TaxID=877455 RepID=F0T8V5_METLA|nr:DNA methyltransferase [Methanobacterium lacus]ADZ09783.1 hypothetical protein Metbo_1556 [Methanobacterium lacus]